MARILALSSQVARGHVGLSAIVPALQRLGHEVWPLPTILLSNHPGHAHAAGIHVEPAVLEEIVDALERNGWLGEIEAVITGYLPTAEHVHLAGSIVRRLRSTQSICYLCDPVLGDEPKGLYIDPKAATAIRDVLQPLADVITPNRFELQWLTDVSTKSFEDVIRASAVLKNTAVVVTSALKQEDTLENLLVEGGRVQSCSVPFREVVPHGTGDFFSGLILGHYLNGASMAEAMAKAAAGVEQAIAASAGREELALIPSQEAWTNVTPLPIHERALP